MATINDPPIPDKMLEESGLVTNTWSRFFFDLKAALESEESTTSMLHSGGGGGGSVNNIGSESLTAEETFNLIAVLGTL